MLVKFALSESKEPRIGGEGVLSRLSELMFVDVVRRYLESLPPDRYGLARGTARPVRRTRADGIASQSRARLDHRVAGARIGLSRSALAERFTQFVGRPPMQYLANWRMQLAANQLLSGTESIASVASQVGYESEAAFSRAFKKMVGAPPGQWRDRRTL